MWHLSNSVFREARGYPWNAYIIGCGGTGGWVAEEAARVLPQNAKILLVDNDRVEERNLVRQNFYPGDIGELKTLALAKRLSERYDRPIAYSTFPIAMIPLTGRGLIIGCLDNGPARADIASKVDMDSFWWVDAGNGNNFGQILIGNSKVAKFYTNEEIISQLPLPSIQRPEILLQAPITPQLNCIDIPDQGPTINQIVASLTIEVIRRIVIGTCPWMQIVVDMDKGTMFPVMATPENCRQILHTRNKKKVQIEE